MKNLYPKLIEQNKYRVFNDCPRRLYLSNGNFHLETYNLLVSELYLEYHFLQNIPGYDLEVVNHDTLFKRAAAKIAEKYKLTESEYKDLFFKERNAIFTFVNRLNLKNYISIYSSYEENIKIKNSVIRIKISGIAMTENKSIRGWVFSPHNDTHSIEWDVLHKLQYQALVNFYKNFRSDEKLIPILYIIYKYNDHYKMTSIQDKLSALDKKQLLLNEYALTNNIYYANNPCRDKNCIYKKECINGI